MCGIGLKIRPDIVNIEIADVEKLCFEFIELLSDYLFWKAIFRSGLLFDLFNDLVEARLI